MSFHIPAATSLVQLFVIKTDWYANKETGEVRASVQALSPIPADAFGNAQGFEVTEYSADKTVLDQVNLSNGPAIFKFEAVVRPITNRFGKTTNTQFLTAVLPDRAANQPKQPEQKPA